MFEFTFRNSQNFACASNKGVFVKAIAPISRSTHFQLELFVDLAFLESFLAFDNRILLLKQSGNLKTVCTFSVFDLGKI